MAKMIEVDPEKVQAKIDGIWSMVRKLSRYSFTLAFDIAISIEKQKGLKERNTLFVALKERWSYTRENQLHAMKKKTEEKIAYLQSIKQEALVYYDKERTPIGDKKEEKIREKSNT